MQNAALVVVALTAVLIAPAVLKHWRARRTLRSMTALLEGGQHDQVLAHRVPPKAYRTPLAQRVRATSALLTGRNALTLTLLDDSRPGPGRRRAGRRRRHAPPGGRPDSHGSVCGGRGRRR